MAKTKQAFTFEPVGLDVFDRRKNQPEPGTLVVKTQPAGCPKNGTMGHCFVADAETGQFYGLVLVNSLKKAGEGRSLMDTFSISIGDEIKIGEVVQGRMAIQTYRVTWVSRDGAIRAANVKTGLERTWPGYGRVVRREAKV